MAGSFFVPKIKKCVRYPCFFMVQSKKEEKREREIISLAGY